MGWYDVPRPLVPDLIVQHGRNQALSLIHISEPTRPY